MLVVGAAVLAALPLFGSLYFTFHETVDRSHRRLADLSEAVAQRTEEVLLTAEAAIADVAFEAAGGCTEELIHELRAKAVTVSAIQTMGYLTSNGLLRCTSSGMIDPPLWIELDPAIAPPGALLWFTPPAEHVYTTDVTISAFHRLRDGSLLVVDFPPDELADAAGQTVLGDEGHVEVQIAGVPIARFGAPAGAQGHDYLTATRDVGVYQAQVVASASRAWAVASWRDNAIVTGSIGAVAGAALALAAAHLGRKRLSLKAELSEGLDNREFEIWYQPVIDLKGYRCDGAEALIRWRHPERDMVPPDLFIALAEESGVIIPMTQWLLEEVGRQMGEMLRQDPTLHIGINLAPAHFNNLDIVDDARKTIARYGINPRQILFELTERGLVDKAACREVIAALSGLGSEVAIDDFGTGYSSLAYIEKFELDYLKVDKVFVSAIGLDAPAARLTEVIIDMARSLSLKTIAEGVETEAQVRYLTERGVDFAQGYYFSRPLTAAAFHAYVADDRSAGLATAIENSKRATAVIQPPAAKARSGEGSRLKAGGKAAGAES